MQPVSVGLHFSICKMGRVRTALLSRSCFEYGLALKNEIRTELLITYMNDHKNQSLENGWLVGFCFKTTPRISGQAGLDILGAVVQNGQAFGESFGKEYSKNSNTSGIHVNLIWKTAWCGN